MKINLVIVTGLTWHGGAWFRVGKHGIGFRFADHRVSPPLFGERAGMAKRIHVGPYCLKYLKPIPKQLRNLVARRQA